MVQAILFAVALLCVTGIYYVAMRQHNVELSFDQLSTFERQTRMVANRTLYLSEQHRSDATIDLAVALAREDWAKVSAKIEYVAFVFDDTFSFVGNRAWGLNVARAIASFDPPGLGLTLFPCGCVVPNAFLRRSDVRFAGLECAMLPGFVFPHSNVVFIEDPPSVHTCRGAKRMHPVGWYSRNEHKIEQARNDYSALVEEVRSREREKEEKIGR